MANDGLSPIGRHLVCLTIEQNYLNYKNVLNYISARPELKNTTSSIPRQIFLCGLPRSGTTLLFNLLSCDPASRAPLCLDFMDPVPPLSRSDTDGQMKRNLRAMELVEMMNGLGLADYQKKIQAAHPSFAYEEDLFMLGHVGILWLSNMLVPNKESEYHKWFLNNSNKDIAYEYHKMFYHMLNSVDEPSSHWILKAPIHSLYLDTLLRYYPQASLIMTHRRLDEVLPSCAKLTSAFVEPYLDKDKPDIVTNRNMVLELLWESMDTFIKRLVEFRRKNTSTPVMDIHYEDLIAQPIDTVRKIYQDFGISWSQEFEHAMIVWLRDNPQNKYGRHNYTLEEFGLKRETIEKRYEEYNAILIKPLETLKTDNNAIKN